MSSEFVPLSALSRREFLPAPPVDGPRQRQPRTERAIVKKTGRAIADFDMIADGDRIMVCISGGKDSYALLEVLRILQRRAPVRFELLAVNVDQGWPGYDTAIIAEHLASTGVPYRMITRDFASVVEANLAPGATPCSLCSRLRRGVLYNLAGEFACTKIALGHHADDLIETLMLNLMYSGKLAAMPAKLHSDDGRNTVIRPLAYVPEALLSSYAQEREFPVVRCGCPSCGLPEQKRQVVKRLLQSLEEADPGVKHHMLAALGNIKPSQLLDRALQGQADQHERGAQTPGELA
ncbi:tRNA 2-thiocytidine(32) synthetase TtcA [Haliangium ochraceum]|uniref:PP-loop domain protein n=1 Tax=Haliangium ochraceum (strain DSM 14365 / JCM 11303 / SMP-2) TaxID=502025 RepID=D0LKN0_HALO1|nr:tRNA 2-thiocytidine(32) synthetase TtcA [Haliangium ochraceum]ACY15078.1 PP-loop domain protein [Haliangium ochraceum DSM 14365]